MIDQTQMTLHLIDGQTEQVLNIPTANRRSPETKRAALGEITVRFGKHKGMRLKEVPLHYLAWCLDQEPTTELFRKFQQHAKAYLEN